MPGFDKTGPEEQGSQTGRRQGRCNPENLSNSQQSESFESRRFGRGGGGQKQGRGRGHGKGTGEGLGNKNRSGGGRRKGFGSKNG